MKRVLLLATCVVSMFASSYSFADLAISTMSGSTFLEGSGVIQIPLYAHQDGPTPTTLSIGGFLTVTGGPNGGFVDSTPLNINDQDVFTWSGAGGGVFASNIVSAGTNSQVTTPPFEAAVGIEFNLAQSFNTGLVNRQLLGNFNFDTTGMIPGTYTLDLSGAFADVPIFEIDGGFTITAVPEPASLMTAVSLALAGVLHRRKRTKTIAVANKTR